MTIKEKRKQWHKDYRDFVFNHFNGICQVCETKMDQFATKWDVHHYHYHYKNKLYDTPALELIENNVITLICRQCHDKAHTAQDPDSPKHLENKFPCEVCGKLERGIFDRKKGEKLDKLLCRQCFFNFKNKTDNQLRLF